jgi:hypothetical protein
VDAGPVRPRVTVRILNAFFLQFVVWTLAGWIQRRQQSTIDYLVEENRVLREQLGKRRVRLTDDQRRRLAVRAKALGRVVSSGPFDVETAIERSLRLAFKGGPPATEKAVQDVVEVILSSLGVEFTREQETAPVGPRAFRPDFALTPMDLALEVKFTNDKHSSSKAQDEISAGQEDGGRQERPDRVQEATPTTMDFGGRGDARFRQIHGLCFVQARFARILRRPTTVARPFGRATDTWRTVGASRAHTRCR